MASREEKIAALQAGKTREQKIMALTQQPAREMTAGETLGGQLENAPGSLMNLAENVTYPLRHPIDFSNSVTNFGKGVYQKFTPGVQPQEQLVDQAWQGAKDKYGSLDAIKRTAYEDPFGLAADASGLTALAPSGVRAIRNAPKIGRAVSDAVDREMYRDSYPSEAYRSVAKTSFQKKNLDKNINTALEERLVPNAEGMSRRSSLVAQIDNDIERMINQATEAGGQVGVDDVFRGLDDLKTKMGSAMNADGLGNMAKIDAVQAKIAEAAMNEGRTTFSVNDLQELKRNLYRDSSFDIKQQNADPAVNQGRKNIARTAKEDIEGFVPETKDLNRRYADLIDVDESLTRASRRIEGRDPSGIGTAIRAGSMAAVGAAISPFSPMVGGAVGGIGSLGSLIKSYRNRPINMANRAIRVHHAKKGLLADDLADLDIFREADKAGVSKALVMQGLLQGGRLEDF